VTSGSVARERAAQEPTGATRGRRAHLVATLVELVSVSAVYLAATVAVTWPWATRFRTHVLGFPSDNFEYLWKFWWVREHITDLDRLFHAAHVFPQAGGYHLGATDMTPSATFLFAPLTAIAGPVITYNVVMILSFVLAGLGVYLLARRFGASRLPALTAGAAFAFCPFHFWQTVHLNIFQIGYTPFVFLAADRLLFLQRRRDGLLFGVAMALAGLTSWYRLVFLILTVPVFLLFRWRRAGASLPRLAGPLAVAGATAIVLIGPFLVPAIDYTSNGGSVPSFDEAALYGLSVEDYLMPPPGHPVTEYWVHEALQGPNGERIVYPGLFVLALALGSIAIPRLRRPAAGMTALAVVAAVVSFGPVLRWFGEPVIVEPGPEPPRALHELALASDPEAGPAAMAVPLPVYPIARHAPGIGGLRVWARAGEITNLALDVLAALALTALLAGMPRPARLVVGVVVAGLVMVDAHTRPEPLVPTAPRPVDRWLAAQPGRFRIVTLPWVHGQSGTQLWYSIFNGKEVALAQASAPPPSVAEGYVPIRDGFPYYRNWVPFLQRWGVRYVLVDQAVTPMPDLAQPMEGNGLSPVTRQGSVEVYAVP
jgi:hypothetical protein